MNVVECCGGRRYDGAVVCDFGRVARVHDERRNGVPESMKAAPRNIERVEDWPKPVFHDVVARRRPVVSGSKQPTLRLAVQIEWYCLKTFCERIRRVTGAALALLFVDCAFRTNAERRM